MKREKITRDEFEAIVNGTYADPDETVAEEAKPEEAPVEEMKTEETPVEGEKE